jgi:hypothetical protein
MIYTTTTKMVPQVTSINISLTLEEASLLLAVCDHITGIGHNRRFFDNIGESLYNDGIKPMEGCIAVFDVIEVKDPE